MSVDGPPAASAPFSVVGGGIPSNAQLAAIAEALRCTASQDAEAPRATEVPAWTSAALVEGTTSVTITSPGELRP